MQTKATVSVAQPSEGLLDPKYIMSTLKFRVLVKHLIDESPFPHWH